MKLLDRLVQFNTPFVVQDDHTGTVTRLAGAADHALALKSCPLRYVLDDSLTRLCANLAFSKGLRALECADLIHVPAERMWLEWSEAPWRCELAAYGFELGDLQARTSGRRGVLIESTRDGRRGSLKTFWSSDEIDGEVLASSMEAYFDLDVPDGEAPVPQGEDAERFAMRVYDQQSGSTDLIGRCFRFRYERSWQAYYQNRLTAAEQAQRTALHALGTIAHDVPLVLAFLLLLAARTGLPRRAANLEQINRARQRRGRPALLDHFEVSAPVLPDLLPGVQANGGSGRRHPRLHHVRGHLMRRGNQLFWRMPHLRGNARSGIGLPRTVTWTYPRLDVGQRPASSMRDAYTQ